jgi:hypothetical protein
MNAFKELKELERETKRKQYPNIPDHALPYRTFSDATTNELTQSIIAWLTLNGHYCSRIQSQGQWNQRLKMFIKSNVKKGIGDIMAVVWGKTLMIEVKVGRDKLSEHQIKTQQQVAESGGLYYVARNFQDFFDFYQTIKQ